MSRSFNSTGRSRIDAKHVRLHEFLLASTAWQSLNCYARCTLIELYRLHNGSNNGTIYLSQRDLARRLGSSRATAINALAQLQDCGFIVVTERGGFSRKVKHASSWRLTEFEYNGKVPTKDFMRWPKPCNNEQLAKAA